jgi:hypothetical protein
VNQPHILLKIGVVSSSLLLGSGFVLYRSGALDRVVQPGVVEQAAIVPGDMVAPPDTPGTVTGSDSGTGKLDTSKAARRDRAYWYGSKSSPDIIRLPTSDTALPDSARRENPVDEGPPDTTPRRERFMGGSKSLAPLIEPSSSDSQKSTPTGTEQRPKKNR